MSRGGSHIEDPNVNPNANWNSSTEYANLYFLTSSGYITTQYSVSSSSYTNTNTVSTSYSNASQVTVTVKNSSGSTILTLSSTRTTVSDSGYNFSYSVSNKDTSSNNAFCLQMTQPSTSGLIYNRGMTFDVKYTINSVSKGYKVLYKSSTSGVDRDSNNTCGVKSISTSGLTSLVGGNSFTQRVQTWQGDGVTYRNNYLLICDDYADVKYYNYNESLVATRRHYYHKPLSTYYNGSSVLTGQNLPSVTRTGYSFKGWYTSSTSSATKVTTSTTFDGVNTSLYAQWDINTYTYTITYYNFLGTNSTNIKITSPTGTVSNGSSLALNGKATVTHTYDSSSCSITISCVNTSYGYCINRGSACTNSSTWDEITFNWTPTSNSSVNIYVAQRQELTINYYSALCSTSTNISITQASCWVSPTSIASGKTCSVQHIYSTTSYTVKISAANTSYTYFISTSTCTTSSSTGSISYSWTPSSNKTINIYVAQRYTVSFAKGNEDSGTLPSSLYKIYGTNATLPENNLTHKGFEPNGWNTSIDGTGTSYTNGQSYSTNANLTLYTNWTAKYVLMDVTIVTLSKTGTEMPTQGGTMSAISITAPNNQVTSETVTSAYPTLQEYETTITATAKTGYVFLGFTTSKANPSKPTSAPDSNTYTFTPPAAGTTTFYPLYIYFRQVSDNRLKWTGEDGGYWYFEDGEYPQSEVADSSIVRGLNNMSTSTSAEYSISYHDGKNVVEIPIYLYSGDGQKYACATMNGIVKWFKVEPIRWRVSDYGTSQAQPPPWWQYYGDTMTQVAVSDKILFASAMTPDKIDDSKETSSGTFWLNDYVQNSPVNGLKYGGLEYLILQDKFLKAGGQNIVESELTRKEMTVFANKDITFNSKAKLTAFASFLLYGTTAYADTYDSYWTRDLQIGEQNSQYGCGVVVTSYGKEALQWLNTMCGVRLTYGCSEVSRY